MLKKWRAFRAKWNEAAFSVYQLDELLEHVPPAKASPRQKKEWFLELLFWLFKQRLIGADVAVINARLRFLLMVLDRNPQWKANFTETVNAIIMETSTVELFVGIGLATEFTFFGEFTSRVSRKFVLQAPNDHDFAHLFATVFSSQEDEVMISEIQPALFEQFVQLLGQTPQAHEAVRRKIRDEAAKALRILTVQFCATSFSSSLGQLRSRELQPDEPFLELTQTIDDFIAGENTKFLDNLRYAEAQFRWIGDRLEEFGVSLDVVYQLEIQKNRMIRLGHLAMMINDKDLTTQEILNFLGVLVEDCSSTYSIRSLMARSSRMMAKKIVETNADVGDHYIAHDREAFKSLFWRSCGGGLITAATVIFKFWIHHIGSVFHGGFIASMNYSISFLAIHFSGLSLGTKQPAMTAAALAEKIGDKPSLENLAALQTEMRFIIWSQITSVAGNVIAVIPGVLLVDLIAIAVQPGFRHFLTEAQALETVHSLSVIGPSWIYAAFTGILLFSSSVAGGWANNWFILRDQYEAIANNRRLRVFLGTARAEALAAFWKRNISGIVSNVTLGFLLGMTPAILKILGIPLEVRHVTLMSGQLGLSLPVLGLEAFKTPGLWSAFAGIAVIGVLNISVSFILALWVAVRSKGIAPSARWKLYLRLPSTRFFSFGKRS